MSGSQRDPSALLIVLWAAK